MREYYEDISQRKWWIDGKIDPEIVAIGVKDGKIAELPESCRRVSSAALIWAAITYFPAL